MTDSHVEKVAGILGGMGPEATVDLMGRIIQYTPAQDDADHIRCIIDNDPKVPSRIKALIEGDGENPGPYLAEMGRRLEAWGADFLCIPCNTAHYYYEYVDNAVRIPVLNLLDLTVSAALQVQPPPQKVGVLCSTAVITSKLYEERFAKKNIEVLYPEPAYQDSLLRIIKSVKAGNTSEQIKKEFSEIISHVASREAELGIIACTELGVIKGETAIPIIDAADVLAQEIVSLIKTKA